MSIDLSSWSDPAHVISAAHDMTAPGVYGHVLRNGSRPDPVSPRPNVLLGARDRMRAKARTVVGAYRFILDEPPMPMREDPVAQWCDNRLATIRTRP